MIDIYQRNRRLLNLLYNNLNLEEFSELSIMMKKDPRLVIGGMVCHSKLEKNFDLVKKINTQKDLSRCTIIDFINYNYTLGNDPLFSLIDIIDIMTRPIVPNNCIEANFHEN